MRSRLSNSSSFPFREVALAGVVLVAVGGCSKPGSSDSKDGSQTVSVNKPIPKVKKGPAAVTPPASANVSFVRPALVKGIYLTAWSAGSPNKLAKLIKWEHTTEMNAMVIDVRDSGDMYFPTHIPLADETQGKKNLAITKPARLMKTLSDNHIWPIARIACFRDQFVPVKFPDRAVQTPSGAAWHDRSKHYWLDPYDKRNWQFIADTVEYAMSIGFPEIQLDYVRFPSEGKSSSQVFPNAKKYSTPVAKHEDVIAAFAKFIQEKVKAKNCYISADIFGIISESKSDQGIGQELEKMAAPFDTISPMIYPSHFAKGEYGIANPNASPYEIIVKSLHDFERRLPGKSVRPWLQDFSLFGVHYGAPQVRAQIKALNAEGYKEFLLWNAGNTYSSGGPRSEKEAAADEAKVVTSKAPVEPATPVKGSSVQATGVKKAVSPPASQP